MMRRMERKKTGRPRKAGGPRRTSAFELPVTLLDALAEYAKREGMHQVDVVGEAIAQRIGVPYLPQEGLPLNKAS
jgi:hypothetical protein